MLFKSDFYNADYYSGKTSSYNDGYFDEPKKWEALIDSLLSHFPRANRILELGCAYGFMVKRLRSCGLEAFGVDFSEYALSQAPPDVRPFLRQADLTGDFIGKFKLFEFDVVCSFDVLEHIEGHSIHGVISELKRIGLGNFHQIETLSLPQDKDPTHVNIKPLSYWKHKAPEWVIIESRKS